MLLIAAMGQQNMNSFFLDRGSLIIKSVFYFPVIVTQSIYIDIKPGIFNAVSSRLLKNITLEFHSNVL